MGSPPLDLGFYLNDITKYIHRIENMTEGNDLAFNQDLVDMPILDAANFDKAKFKNSLWK